jgi:hypothetical protein
VWVVLQIAIGSRKHSTVQVSCLRFRLSFLELLSAIIKQPAWREAPENEEDKNAILELLVTFLTHPEEPLADFVRHLSLHLPLPCTST